MDGRPASASQHTAASAELIARAAGTYDADADSAEGQRVDTREVLLRVMVAGKQLARSLDALARHYGQPAAAEPSAVYIALDQAAAAAEDVATCAHVAAQAVDEQQ